MCIDMYVRYKSYYVCRLQLIAHYKVWSRKIFDVARKTRGIKVSTRETSGMRIDNYGIDKRKGK